MGNVFTGILTPHSAILVSELNLAVCCDVQRQKDSNKKGGGSSASDKRKHGPNAEIKKSSKIRPILRFNMHGEP